MASFCNVSEEVVAEYIVMTTLWHNNSVGVVLYATFSSSSGSLHHIQINSEGSPLKSVCVFCDILNWVV